MLPFALATLFVLALCVPSYLWLEPSVASERVGVLCVVLGFLGAATWFLSIVRTAFSLFASLRHNRLCRLAGLETRIPRESSSMLVVEHDAPLLAMSGLLRPRLLISRGVLRALSAEELDAALRPRALPTARRATIPSASSSFWHQTCFPFSVRFEFSSAPGQNLRSGPPTIKPPRETPAAPFLSPPRSFKLPAWAQLLACLTSLLRFSPAIAISPLASIACSTAVPRTPARAQQMHPMLLRAPAFCLPSALPLYSLRLRLSPPSTNSSNFFFANSSFARLAPPCHSVFSAT